MDPIDLSIIIPTYNRSDALRALLQSLNTQSISANRYEVIVIDDGSATPVALDPRAYRFSLILKRQKNAGPAAARNVGIACAKAPLTLILNDDAIADPQLLQVHLENHAQRTDKVAVMGQFPFAEHLLTSPFMQVLDASNLLFPHRYLTAGGLHGPGFFWTCNISLPTAALRAVGGFDSKNFRQAICEDVEIGHRLDAIGYKVLYIPEAKCLHEHHISPQAYARRAVKLGTNTFKLAELHGWHLIDVKPDESLEDVYTRRRADYENMLPEATILLNNIIAVEQSGLTASIAQLNTLKSAISWVNQTHYLGSMTEALGEMLYAKMHQSRALRIA
jgi:GT2 family glycosyltransferase